MTESAPPGPYGAGQGPGYGPTYDPGFAYPGADAAYPGPASEAAAGAPQPGTPSPPALRRPRGADRAVPVPPARMQGTPPVGMTGPLRQLLSPVTGSLRMLGRGDDAAEQVLRVDWPQCRAHGLCHEIVPEAIHLDEWGYPFFDDRPLSGEELIAVRKAVQVCPTLALRLSDAPPR